jgi:transposase-like protein
MATLKFMEQQALDPKLATCPYCVKDDRLGVHSHQERRLICHRCERTFAETKGTVFFGLHYPIWVVVLVLTLLAYGCPPAAIVAAFLVDERTVAAWHRKAGKHGQRVQDEVVCDGQVELGQVQADELCVKVQGGQKVWVATAMSVFSRLFLWGQVSTRRDKRLIEGLMGQVRAAAGSVVQPVLVAVDGLAAYPKAIRKAFSDKFYSGQPGRPPWLPWSDLHIVQVVKQRRGYKLHNVSRRLAHGCLKRVYDLVAMSQIGFGMINTAYIERLNATFRARMPALVRRTRGLARTTQRIETELFWSGSVYNFCTIHASLEATPAMAAGLTDHLWSVEQLLRLKLPLKSLHGVG